MNCIHYPGFHLFSFDRLLSGISVVLYSILCYIPDSAAGVGDWTTYTFANDVRAIAFDQGDLWLATVGGVVHFDASAGRFTQFTNTDGLSGNDVTSLAVDSNRDVWFGTGSNGLSRRRQDTGEWRTFTLLDGLASERVSAVLLHDNSLWVGTADGLSLFKWGRDPDEERDTFIFSDAYRASRGVPVGDLNALAVDGGTVWVATETGIAAAPLNSPNLKDPATWTTYSPADGLPDRQVTAIAVSGSDVWAGTGNGIARFDGTRWIPVNTGLNALEIRDLTFIGGTLWAATGAEVARYDGMGWISVGGGVGPLGARTVEEDANGDVWIGSGRLGLGKLTRGVWQFFPSDGPYGNVVDATFVDRDDVLWFGFNEGGVSRFDGVQWTSYDTDDGLTSGTISMIGEHMDGRKWFGSFGNGLSRFDDRGTIDRTDDLWEVFNQTNSVFEGVPEDPNFVVVNAWAADSNNGQWFANFGIGAQFQSSDGIFTTFREGVASLSSARLRGIAVSADSSVWFASDSRLSRFQPASDTWQVFGTSEGLLSPQINAVVASITGDVWAGTDAGISRIESGNIITSFGLPAGLNTNRVTALASDARGNLWVGSASGLGRFDPETFEWEVFTMDNSPLADPLIKSLTVHSESGEIWIGTGKGVSRFESGILPARSTQANVPVYPNPFLPSSGDTEVFFDQLADGAQVSILTVDGMLVRQISADQIIAQRARWDGTNTSGSPVAGGVYFFVVSAPDGSHYTGKIAVIR